MNVGTLGGKHAQQSTQTSLVSLFFVIRFFCIILLELGVMFVDGVVCHVHEQVLHVSSVGLLVRLSAEAGNSLLVDIDPQGIDAVQQHVNTKVVLQVVDQMGPV